jgi:hypothetical protein
MRNDFIIGLSMMNNGSIFTFFSTSGQSKETQKWLRCNDGTVLSEP